VVDEDTWHSADPIGPEVETRDSILLTYFADTAALRFLSNRGKRFGNFLLNELRNTRNFRGPGGRRQGWLFPGQKQFGALVSS
jgi:hypothetical protein